MSTQPATFREYFFDSSALVKLVLDEPGSTAARQLLEAALPHCHTSKFAIIETLGAVKRAWHKELAEAIDIVGANERYKARVFKLLQVLSPNYLTVSDADPQLDTLMSVLRQVGAPSKAQAIDVIDRLHVSRFTDTFWKILAPDNASVMVSSDERLNKLCQSEGIAVFNPENPDPSLWPPPL